jgi:hypothetical protein
MFDEERGMARAVFVDSEPKVVQETCRGLRSVRASNVCLDTSGRGNNWAQGFSACAVDESPLDATAMPFADSFNWEEASKEDRRRGLFSQATDAIRREAERMGCLRSAVMIHSVGGGTGSGTGSALLQHMR